MCFMGLHRQNILNTVTMVEPEIERLKEVHRYLGIDLDMVSIFNVPAIQLR